MAFEGVKTKLFGVFHDGAIRFANGSRPEWPLQSFSAREFTNQWAQHASDHNILYFFCHADGERLMIGQTKSRLDDGFVPYNFSTTIQACNVPRPGGLIVLNGCKTAVFSGNGKWLKATRTRGFSGFIGTEAIVPSRFAWPFGNDLVKLLLSSQLTPLQALQELWQIHWPLSLLYSLYCVADVTIRPSVANTDYLRRIQKTNYSSLNLGAGHPHSTLPFGDFGSKR